MKKITSFFLTCVEDAGFMGPYHCTLIKEMIHIRGQEFRLVTVDPAWKVFGKQGFTGEIESEFVVSTRRIEEKFAVQLGVSLLTVNIFRRVTPDWTPKRTIDTDFGLLYLFAIGEAHATESDAKAFIDK